MRFIPLICDGSINRVWNTSKRQLLYRTLILQETCDTGPPVFPHVLSGYHTLGDCDAIPKVAAELAPVLRELYKAKNLNNNYVVMMLLVRNALGSWVSQKEISDLHIERFRTFSLSDLVLPYSCMFERNSSMFERNQFVRNREDLALVIGNSTRARPFLGRPVTPSDHHTRMAFQDQSS